MQKFPMILAGKHSTSNQDLPVRDKYTQEIIATVPLATPARVCLQKSFSMLGKHGKRSTWVVLLSATLQTRVSIPCLTAAPKRAGLERKVFAMR